MVRKSEYFEQADKYICSELTLAESKEFVAQMAIDSDLTEEVELHLEVEQAICEQDVIDLRNKLNQIVQNITEVAHVENISVIDSFNFNLSEECSYGKKLTSINTETLLNFGNSFPKIHLYQHKVASKENIHQFYKEQFDSNVSNNEESEFTPFDEQLFSEVQTALEEGDIAELRANLKQVSQSIPSHHYSYEDVENYINDQMDEELRLRFEEELTVSKNLAYEVQLIREIDLSVAESDILDLRANLNRIQHIEVQQPMSRIEDIEDYINNELSIEQMVSFEEEFNSSIKLQEEIELIKNINNALAEDDVMRLRNNLQNIASQIASGKQNERAFAGRFNIKRFVASTVAASIIILLGVTGLLSKHQTADDLYQKFYTKYEIAGTVRSANFNENKTFDLALKQYQDKNYDEAINLFAQVISDDPKNMASHFYSGVSLQEKGRYQNAIKEYNTVIVDKDNLFTEQSEWYTGLCLLQTNDNKRAYKHFKKIAESKGFYQNKANEIIRKMKLTD